MRDVGRVTDLGDGVAVQAGEDRDAENERRIAPEPRGGFPRGFFGGAHHFGTATGMDGEHLDIELNGGSAQALLAELAQLPIEIERFELVEPTLHEIFIEKVGAEARRAPRQEGPHA